MNFFLISLSTILLTNQPSSETNRIETSGLPVEMTAKGGLRVDLERKLGFAKQDVVIRRADVTVCCDEAVASYSENKIETVECRGRVVIVRPDGTTARADRAVFLANKDQLSLTGTASLKSATTQLTGEEIIYDIAKDKLFVKGKNSRFRFIPQDKPKNKRRAERKCPS
ncbi:MAG: LptA/OstA family protein [Myxococcota bacterium]|nr:LptA/OstA family protein [Myxococcota bacterium]